MDVEVDPDSTAARALSTAELLPHLLDVPGRRVIVVALDEAGYRSSPFLDHRTVGRGAEASVPFDRLAAAARSIPPPQNRPIVINHIGHCGSTLLSRLLGSDTHVLPIREPQVLTQLAFELRRSQAPESLLGPRVHEWLDLTLRMLTTSFQPGQTPLLKPNSGGASLLRARPDWLDADDLLVAVSLASHVATMVDPGHRSELRQYCQLHAMDWVTLTGTDPAIHRMTTAELAALSWLTPLAMWSEAKRARGTSSCSVEIDFDAFLATPGEQWSDVLEGLGRTQRPLDRNLFASDAKGTSRPMNPALRSELLSRRRSEHRREIDAARRWVMEQRHQHPHLDIPTAFEVE